MILPLGPLSDHLALFPCSASLFARYVRVDASISPDGPKAVLVVRSLISRFGIEPINVPHRSIFTSKVDGQGSPLE